MMLTEQDVRFVKLPGEVWAEALKILEKTLPEPTFHTWIKSVQLIEMNGQEATLAVTNDFGRGMVMEQVAAIAQALSEVVGTSISAKVVVREDLKVPYTPTLSSINVQVPEPLRSEDDGMSARPHAGSFGGNRPIESRNLAGLNLNPKHTFDAFVVGSNNRFSHSAALAVAKTPGQAYNPLFVYGGVGLGKTHLMHAIGNQVLQHSPHLVVRYVSCEKFMNEMINAIGQQRMIEFRKRYRQVDVLLVDDIQFLQGKESTQEEFFHTFNALRESGRQIVLSSDRAPSAIAKLEERLRSRFEWGLITDIQAPDLETRVAILQKKCQLEAMRVSAEALEYIATLFTTNIRELEGALIRANAYANLMGTDLTMDVLSDVLKPARSTATPKSTLTIEHLTETVAAHFRVEASELRSSKRSQDLALPRHVAMYLAHEMISMSFPRIGEAFGNRKHTSVIYAHKRVTEQLPGDIRLAEAVRQIRRQLGS